MGTSEKSAIFVLMGEHKQIKQVESKINVSSTNSEQSKLCINGPLYIDAWLLWKQAIGCNSP